MNKTVYLDHASATPLDERVLVAMQPYFAKKFYNPSAIYSKANEVKEDINNAKKRIAHHLGVKPGEIIVTSGGTEANNLAIYGVMSQYNEAKMLYSAIEHESIREPGRQFNSQEIKVDKNGFVDLNKLKIDDDVVLISVMYANNEIGTIQPIRQIKKIILETLKSRRQRGIKLPLYFHSDACQATLYLDLHVSRLGVDIMSINGGKIYGPKGAGILYASGGINLNPQILGGGQQRNLRSGTENAANVVGLAEALDIAAKKREKEDRRLLELQKIFITEISKLGSKVQLNGSSKKRLPANIHLTFFGVDNERLLFQLDNLGILAAAGSACSASSEEPSHVLKALGLTDEEAQSSIRFTMGRSTTKEDIKYTVENLKKLI